MIDNVTPHRSSEYDDKVKKTIPFYENFHLETINLVQTINPGVKKWLDTGCGTGYLVEKAVVIFYDCRFVLADSSSEMIALAKERLKDYKSIEYLTPVKIEDMKVTGRENYDVVTAVQTHHYLNRKDRIRATRNCYNLLRDGGIYVAFENIRPENDMVLDFQLDRWMNFQLLKGRSREEVRIHKRRFGAKYFPIRVREHIKLLNSIGFRAVEIFWLSYLQAGFFCIK